MRLVVSIVKATLWPIYGCILVYSVGVATYAPVVPTLLTNYFAGIRAGNDIVCEDFSVGQQPAACKDAHSDVVLWSSVTSFFSNAIIAFLLSPLVGDLSDQYGRKIFLVAGLMFALLPVCVLLLYTYGYIQLFWYYPASAINGSVSFLSVSLAAIADRLPSGDRAGAFGLLIACFAAGFLVGPLLGGFLPTHSALWICVAATTLAALLVLFFQPETLPALAQKKGGAGRSGPGAEADGVNTALLDAEEQQQQQPRTGQTDVHEECRKALSFNPLRGFLRGCHLVSSSSLFVRLSICMALVGIASEGLQTVLIQYLQSKFQFKTSDQGMVYEIWGFGGVVVQGVLLPWLVHWVGERNVLLLGLGVSAVENALLAMVQQKWQAMAAISLGCLSSMSWAAISAIKSMNTPCDQQGLVQGALAGVRSLASGLGPLAYAALFALFSRTSSHLCCHPEVPMLVSCALMCVAFGTVCTISSKDARPAPAEDEVSLAGGHQGALGSAAELGGYSPVALHSELHAKSEGRSELEVEVVGSVKGSHEDLTESDAEPLLPPRELRPT